MTSHVNKPPRKTLPAAPRVTVEVTAEIIEQSIERDSGHCMIADAITAAIPGAKYPSADIQTIRFSKDGYRYTYLTPRAAQWALIQFDQGEKPEPLRFQLRTGQTTRAGSRRAVKTGEPQPRTASQDEAMHKGMSLSTKGFRKNNEAPKDKITFVHGSSRQKHVPEIRGGRVPPVAPLAGGPGMGSTVPRSRRRQFGLRAMDRLQ